MCSMYMFLLLYICMFSLCGVLCLSVCVVCVHLEYMYCVLLCGCF